MSWKGDSQATAPIGRKASTSVMPGLESIQTQEILALNGVPPELSFEVRRQVSLVLKTCTKVVLGKKTMECEFFEANGGAAAR